MPWGDSDKVISGFGTDDKLISAPVERLPDVKSKTTTTADLIRGGPALRDFKVTIGKTAYQIKAADEASAKSTAQATHDARKRIGTTPGQVRSTTQGFGFNFADEVDATTAKVEVGARNLLAKTGLVSSAGYSGDQAHDAVMAAEARAAGRFAEEHPVQNVALAVGGGLMNPINRVGGGLIGRGGLAATTIRSGAVGATYGAVAGAGAAQGGLMDRAQGAGAGAVAGGIFGASAPAAGRVVQGAVGALRGPQASPAAMAEATSALEDAGINVSAVSQVTMGRIGDLIRRGRSPREAALHVVANEELPVALPMTRGDRTGDPGQQLSENLMLRGARGSAASRQMRGLRSEQQDALRGNTAAIADRVSGGVAPTRGASGANVSERLNTMYDQAKTGVDQAYSTARELTDAGNGATLKDAPALGARLRRGVTDFDPERVPSVYREINKLDEISKGGPLSVRDLFETRARLTGLRASNDGVEATAASRAVRELDGHLSDAISQDLLMGDPASVDAWRTAIGSRRDFGKLFEDGDLIEALTARTNRGGESRALKVDANDATNYILGRSDLGFVGKTNLHRDLGRLRTVLGPDSPEWNSIRGEMFTRFASQGEGGMEFGNRQFSGVKFQKSWQDFQRKDPQLANLMYTAEERALIDRFGTLAARVTSSVRGGDNPSNTAVTAMRLLGNLRFLRGLPFIKEMSNEIEVQVNLGAARSATSQTVGKAAPRATTGTGLIPGSAIGAGGGFVGGSTARQ